MPDAEQVFFDASYAQGATMVEPTVPEAAARARVYGDVPAKEGDLIRLPVYEATVRLGEVRRDVAIEACSGTVVSSGIGMLRGVGKSGHIGWLVSGGAAMAAAAMAIRPLGVAMFVVGVLAGLLYGVLAGGGRRSGV